MTPRFSPSPPDANYTHKWLILAAIGSLVLLILAAATGAGIAQAAFPAQESGSISGMLWWDLNANGQWEPGETLIADWPVYLQAEADAPAGPIQARLSDADGAYIFSDLAYGFYILWSQDHRGVVGRQRVEVSEVGAPFSRDIGVVGWQYFFPLFFQNRAE